MTIKQVLSKAETRLSQFEYPRLEASVILCHCLKISREKLYTDLENELSPDQLVEYHMLEEKRIQGVPSAYLTGKKEFYGRDFIVNEHVLIPRPDTEILVETALEIFRTNNFRSVLDLCTGSGCIAVTLYLELGNAWVTASDISGQAAAVFRENCSRYNADINFRQSDLLESVPGHFDMIVSNPPYVTNSEVSEKVQQGLYEPELALAAGQDGLDIIRLIIAKSMDSLNNYGYLLFEAGMDQCRETARLMENGGFTDIRIIKDLAGRDRVITGRKNGNAAQEI